MEPRTWPDRIAGITMTERKLNDAMGLPPKFPCRTTGSTLLQGALKRIHAGLGEQLGR